MLFQVLGAVEFVVVHRTLVAAGLLEDIEVVAHIVAGPSDVVELWRRPQAVGSTNLVGSGPIVVPYLTVYCTDLPRQHGRWQAIDRLQRTIPLYQLSIISLA